MMENTKTNQARTFTLGIVWKIKIAKLNKLKLQVQQSLLTWAFWQD